MKYCSNCGASLSETDLFCNNCGAPCSNQSSPQTPAGMMPSAQKKNPLPLILGIVCPIVVVLIIVALCLIIPNCSSGGSLFSFKEPINLDESVKHMFTEASIGDSVYFGEYNEKTIRWDVLTKEDDKLLLISHDILRQARYSGSLDHSDWPDSKIRDWMNNTFYDSAFTDEEKKIIVETKLTNSTGLYGSEEDFDTLDHVFCLSLDEVNTYYYNDYSRISSTTSGTNYFWWLRTPGNGNRMVIIVNENGSVILDGMYLDNGYGGYRPAMWVDISALY